MNILTSSEINTLPLDKSYYMRLGLLSLVHGKQDALSDFLKAQTYLPDDLKRLKEVLNEFEESDHVNVGESGTLYRFIQYYCWDNEVEKELKKSGTLSERQMSNNSDIVDLSQAELLKLDNGTSQWASAKALCGDPERLNNVPYKLAQTYKVIDEWPRITKIPLIIDPTIQRQAEAFKLMAGSKPTKFRAEQAEDFAFGVVFGFISIDAGAKQWPSLYGHESNRPIEIKEALSQLESGNYITSKDHRIVQAIVMKAKVAGIDYKIRHPDAVTKSWPRFFKFIDLIS